MSELSFSSPIRAFCLAELAEIASATLTEERARAFVISDVAPLSTAKPCQLSMLHQKKYLNQLKESSAGACIIAPENSHYAPKTMHLLVHDNPYKAYALIMQALFPLEKFPPSIAPTAFIAASAKLGSDCTVAHGAFIGEHVVIGARSSIGVNSYIGNNVIIGDDCCIENNVSISHAVIGNDVLVYPGARIGQDGFGFASDAQGHYKIPHRGGVIIGNHVEIGANTCIDRGSIENTVIADWCRLDNLIQIGHNVKLGRGAVLAAQVGIAGSAKLDEFVILGGKVGISNNVTVGRNVTVLTNSIVIQDVEPRARMAGYPAVPARNWLKQAVFLKKMVKAEPTTSS